MDDDIAASLPPPPPSAPARRDAAIAMAMRRFDGVDEPDAPRSAARRSAATAPWWARLGRPQTSALVSVALVALIGLPVAWMSLDRPSGGGGASRAPAVGGQSPGLETMAALPPAVADTEAPARAAKDAAPPALVSEPSKPVELAQTEDAPSPAAAVPSPPPPAAAVARMADAPPVGRVEQSARLAARAPENIVVTGSRIRRSSPDMARPAAPAMEASADAASDIVVTSGRVGAANRRGDWNACTVDDPARSLGGCRSMIDPAAKGANGRAAAQVADGLTRAWDGDLDAAIAAFDRAIAIAPRSASAYLNRGIAYRRAGRLDAALANFDRAVRHAPNMARGYYQRSLAHRARGQARRAQADEDRAIDLDPRYAVLLNRQ